MNDKEKGNEIYHCEDNGQKFFKPSLTGELEVTELKRRLLETEEQMTRILQAMESVTQQVDTATDTATQPKQGNDQGSDVQENPPTEAPTVSYLHVLHVNLIFQPKVIRCVMYLLEFTSVQNVDITWFDHHMVCCKFSRYTFKAASFYESIFFFELVKQIWEIKFSGHFMCLIVITNGFCVHSLPS